MATRVKTTKGYYGIMKAIVTRNILHKPKPKFKKEWLLSNLDFLEKYLATDVFDKIKNLKTYDDIVDVLIKGVSDNPWDVQIWIPGFHGGKAPDPDKIGSDYDVGEYPWAQVCGPLFKDDIGYGNLSSKDDEEFVAGFGVDTAESYSQIWSPLFSGCSYMSEVPSTYPAIGDTVFVMFENGDINLPVVIGSLMCDFNRTEYSGSKSYETVSGTGESVPILDTAALEALDIITVNGGTGVRYPLANGTYPVSCEFGWTYSDGTFHNGIDFSAPWGTPIVASHAGSAVASNRGADDFGLCVEISGTVAGYGISTVYGHMSAFHSDNVTLNASTTVEAGDVIGYVGNSGHTSAGNFSTASSSRGGKHLHFSLKLDNASLVYENAMNGNTYGPKSYLDPTGFVTDGNIPIPSALTGTITLPDKRNT